jgi:hypothetical protein
MFFVDETGHENFDDRNFPVFGMGGCALLQAAIDPVLREPWREMKARHFGCPDADLHALKKFTQEQVNAMGHFFRTQAFGRFAVTMTRDTELPAGRKPIELMPGLLRRRWKALTPCFEPLPVEIAFIHEASERADNFLETYFGKTVAEIDGAPVKAHHGIMPKGDEALEVAHFIVHAAGAQRTHRRVGFCRSTILAVGGSAMQVTMRRPAALFGVSAVGGQPRNARWRTASRFAGVMSLACGKAPSISGRYASPSTWSKNI